MTGDDRASPAMAAADAVDLDDVAARLAVVGREVDDATPRLTEQVRAAQVAAAANGSRRDGEPWARAQVERTALDRIGNQIGDIRARLDAIAGTLAAASASGVDVAGSLRSTGQLIARATALQRVYEQSAAALN